MGIPSRLGSHGVDLGRGKLSSRTTVADERRHLNSGEDEGDSPFDNWIVDALGSIPARMPRYRTSEWEIKEIGFLGRRWIGSISPLCKFDWFMRVFFPAKGGIFGGGTDPMKVCAMAGRSRGGKDGAFECVRSIWGDAWVFNALDALSSFSDSDQLRDLLEARAGNMRVTIVC